LLVGLQTSDDAAVYQLAPNITIVQTIDFFPPVVDDPETYGAIAAANSMSDIFAMGGSVLLALNVAAFPENLPLQILSRILAGGLSKVQEAGGIVAGGHTVTDAEPKYGLAVTGTVDADRVWTKAGAKPGDQLYLTKPLGTGVITTALKNDVVDEVDLHHAVKSMLQLNMYASRAASGVPIHACTDITGFGLAGHSYEIATKSGVRIEIDSRAIPLLPGAESYAADGQIPGGLKRNETYYSAHGVTIAEELVDGLKLLVFNPETSGGLLFACPDSSREEFERRFAEANVPIWEIGRVMAGSGVHVY
jgi:selenide, water dikinase